MMLGMLRSQALRPFYEADAGGSAGASVAGEGSQVDPTSQTPAQAAGGSTEGADLEALRKELKEARAEAAKYRTARKQADEAALAEAGNFKTLYEQTQAELKALKDQATARERDGLLRKVAKDAGLSEDLIDRLHGESEAELLADAKALAKRLTPTPPSTGATNPGAKRAGASEDEQIESMFSKGKQRRSGMKW